MPRSGRFGPSPYVSKLTQPRSHFLAIAAKKIRRCYDRFVRYRLALGEAPHQVLIVHRRPRLAGVDVRKAARHRRLRYVTGSITSRLRC
jgi:hypothetical protein